MSMKYKLLLCVVVLLACTATLFAGSVTIYKQTFASANASLGATDPLNYSKWTYQGQWTWLADVTSKLPTGAIPAEGAGMSGGAGLVYNKNGDYEPNIPGYYVQTLPIDCSKYTSVVLSFARSLTVEDSAFDKATVSVSKDGSAWTTVYTNPTAGKSTLTDNTSNLTDATWVVVSYDISAVADKQAKVYLRWALTTNGNNNNGGSTAVAGLRGWALDDVTLTGAGPDDFYGGTALSGTTFTTVGGVPVAGTGIWQIGAPSVGTSGQTRDADGDPLTSDTVTLGRDPAATSSGSTTDSIIGTTIGGNYPAGMSAGTGAPNYFTWGPFDLTGLQKTALQFQRWLNIGAGSLDKVSVQVHVKNSSLDNPDDPEVVVDNTASSTINVTTDKVVTAANTSEHYAQGNPPANNGLKVTFKYNTNDLAAANAEALRFQYTLDNSAGTVAWVTFAGGIVTTNTDDGTDSGVVAVTFDSAAFASPADYIKAQDNKNFAVRAVLSKNDAPTFSALDSGSTAKAIISEAKVVGVLWKYMWQNPTGSELLADIGDGNAAWSAQSIDLSAFGADNNAAVWVRWSIGPSDTGFSTEYGGWNIDRPAIVEASREWAATKTVAPAGLQWEKSGALDVTAKNTGTAVWDKSYSAYEATGVSATVAKLGEPSQTQSVLSLDAANSPAAQWAVDSIPVSGTVAADGVFDFKANITAPPLSSVVYASPVIATAAADAALSSLATTWDMANATELGDQDWLPTFRGGSIASASVVTSRFPDDAPGQPGNWARFWTEELAGRVPMIVQGFPDGTYRPTVTITRDQIAVYMARATGLLPFTGTGTIFSDVPTDYWAVSEIEACAAAHIVSGYPDRTYQPTGTIGRDAMAKFVALGAGYTIVPKTATSKDDQTAQVAAGWFPDVPIWEDPSTSATERNVFADYINTLVINNVVTGYPVTVGDKTTYEYRPANLIDRASLAVYVWRAIMRDDASAVVLGGPAITDVTLANGAAGYYGYTNSGSSFVTGPFLNDTAHGKAQYTTRLASASDVNYAYITLDAVRLAGAGLPTFIAGADTTGLDVNFQLTRVAGTTGTPVASGLVSIPLSTLNAWVSSVVGGSATGVPYRNVVWQIPTGLQGDFVLVVSVEGKPVVRTPAWSIRGGLYTESFDSGSAGWTTFGLPFSPGPKAYPTDYLSGSGFTANTDLFLGTSSLELTGTQAVVRTFSTMNRHNIRLGLRFAQAGLGSTESLNVEWSKDYGTKGTAASWTVVSGFPLKGSAVPTKLQTDPKYYELPNGNPNADPIVIGADNNNDFAIRLSIGASTSSSAKIYFDTMSIDGT